jgi:hypothetical protein
LSERDRNADQDPALQGAAVQPLVAERLLKARTVLSA